MGEERAPTRVGSITAQQLAQLCELLGLVPSDTLELGLSFEANCLPWHVNGMAQQAKRDERGAVVMEGEGDEQHIRKEWVLFELVVEDFGGKEG